MCVFPLGLVIFLFYINGVTMTLFKAIIPTYYTEFLGQNKTLLNSWGINESLVPMKVNFKL